MSTSTPVSSASSFSGGYEIVRRISGEFTGEEFLLTTNGMYWKTLDFWHKYPITGITYGIREGNTIRPI